jgi:hypothetical protein
VIATDDAPFDRQAVVDAFTVQAGWCDRLGSPLSARLLLIARDDIAAGGVMDSITSTYGLEPVKSALALRLLGGIHRLVLMGLAPRLANHFPSVGGTPDFGDLAEDLIDTAADHTAYLTEGLSVAPQTNETGRAAALFPALCAAVAPTGGRIRLLEIGAAGGLNLLLEQYRYELGDWVWGPASDTATIRTEWSGPHPRDPGPIEVVSRRGCDVEPLDVTDPEQRLRLLSFIWADQDQRFDRMRAAIDVALRSPPVVDRADAGDWLGTQLAEATAEATTTVVQQSVMWQYLSEETRDAVERALQQAGRTATPDAPLVHITFEPGTRIGERGGFAITVTKWPSGESIILGSAQPHGAWVEWDR